MRALQKSSLWKITLFCEVADSLETGWKRRKRIGNDRLHFQVKRIEKLRELITKVRWNEQLKGLDMVEAWGR